MTGVNLLSEIKKSYHPETGKVDDGLILSLYDNIEELKKQINIFIEAGEESKSSKIEYMQLEENDLTHLSSALKEKDERYALLRSFQIVIQSKIVEFSRNIVGFNDDISLQKTTDVEKKTDDKKNKKYVISVIDKPDMRKLFSLFNLVYYLESYFYMKNKSKQSYICIDFEFNVREIALMQVNFEGRHYNHIFLTNPADFEPIVAEVYTKYIMENRFILKVLHGSDSLDTPYLYTQFFKNNKDTIIKYTKSMVDTRFLCEYYKNALKETPKCTLYTALLEFHVIDQKKHDELIKNNDSMGPSQDVNWRVMSLGKSQLAYAYYDVFYLKYLYKNIIKEATNHNESTKFTIRYIPDVTQFVYLERRGVTNMLEKSKKEVDPINNYIVYSKGAPITLINIFNQVMQNINLDSELDIGNIISVNFFRTQMNLLCKKLIYSVLTQKYKIRKDKRTEFNQVLTSDWIIEELKLLKLVFLVDLIEQFEVFAGKKIREIVKA